MTTMPTWMPTGGPEEHRGSTELTPEIMQNFRNHSVVGGHAKWPNQTDITDEQGFYIPDGEEDKEQQEVQSMYSTFLRMSPNPEMFRYHVKDGGSFGMRTWHVWDHNVNQDSLMGELVPVSTTSIFNAYYASCIQGLVKQVGSRVVDIGGGYGHLAKELSSFCEQVSLVELPANLPLAEEYLAGTDVRVLHPSEDFDADIIVNTMSFQHMTQANLEYYTKKIVDSGAKAVYTVNRMTKRDPTDVVIYEYPLWEHFFPIHVKGFGQMWQEWVAQRKPENGKVSLSWTHY